MAEARSIIVKVQVDSEGVDELDAALTDARVKLEEMDAAVHRVRRAMSELTFTTTRETVDG